MKNSERKFVSNEARRKLHREECLRELKMYQGLLFVAIKTMTTLQDPRILFSKMPFESEEFETLQKEIGQTYYRLVNVERLLQEFIMEQDLIESLDAPEAREKEVSYNRRSTDSKPQPQPQGAEQ